MFLRPVRLFVLLAGLVAAGAPALAQPVSDQVIVEARDALRRGDRNRLAALRSVAVAGAHPLALWVDYWDLSGRLALAGVAEVEAFYGRWSGSYVEDRLRNDWLLELGRRRDWVAFARDFPRFRMNDDREVTCYWLLTQHQSGGDVRDAARAAWYARDANDGCHLLAATLYEARQFGAADVWHALRLAMEAGRPRAARAAAGLLGADVAKAVDQILDSPARYFTRRPPGPGATSRQLGALAVIQMAATDADAAARQLEQPWARGLGAYWLAASWAAVARQGAVRQHADALAWYQRAFSLRAKGDDPVALSDETLAWAVRAALRSPRPQAERWALIAAASEAMSISAQQDPAWAYWRARALQARAGADAAGDEARAGAHRLMESIASPLTFYGKLATEDLGHALALPAPPAPLTPAEQAAAVAHPGLTRALQMIALGLRSEGVREWNFSVRGMADRELLAAAQRACDREVWDRCIHTSDRTRSEVDLTQRFPMPFRAEVVAAAREIGVDPAYVYGLIRQESRFVMDARSHVGASGLMQIMPATALWTARRIGLDFKPEMIADRAVNLKLGTWYLKLVLDDFGGSAPMAAAAYNAGPSRSRRWREGALVEPAAWAESIPFAETRDYVKKVLSNATLYAALLKTAGVPALKARLGAAIGPRDTFAPVADRELP